MVDEPAAELAQRQAVAHRDRPRSDETFPPFTKRQSFDRAAGGVRAVEYPHRLAVLGGGLEHVEERGDEGVDSAAEVLQVDDDGVEDFHRVTAGPAHLSIEAEDRDLVDGIGEVLRFDHIVLLIAAKAVLRPESGGDVHSGGSKSIEAVGQVRGD